MFSAIHLATCFVASSQYWLFSLSRLQQFYSFLTLYSMHSTMIVSFHFSLLHPISLFLSYVYSCHSIASFPPNFFILVTIQFHIYTSRRTLLVILLVSHWSQHDLGLCRTHRNRLDSSLGSLRRTMGSDGITANTFDSLPGPILLDGLFQSFLLGTIVNQAFKYAMDYREDSVRKRAFVATVIVLSM